MAAYLLLFRGGKHEAAQQPAEGQANMDKWTEWMSSLNSQGKFAGAQPLKSSGKVIKGTGKQVTDGPFTEGKEIVGGYLICKADSYEEAVAISKGCPILAHHNGIVEIREIQDT